MRVLIEKATNRIIESQSGGVDETAILQSETQKVVARIEKEISEIRKQKFEDAKEEVTKAVDEAIASERTRHLQVLYDNAKSAGLDISLHEAKEIPDDEFHQMLKAQAAADTPNLQTQASLKTVIDKLVEKGVITRADLGIADTVATKKKK